MRSSTSNSNSHRWVRVVLSALLISATFLFGLELFLRRNGYEPSVIDSERLWSHWRRGAGAAGSNTVVLIGSSRMELGFAPKAWCAEYPGHRVVQLAMNGASSVPVLADLAHDDRFRGVVLCEMEAWQLIGTEEKERAQKYVDYFQQKWISPFQDLEVSMRANLQTQFAVLVQDVGYGQAIKGLFQGKGLHLKTFYIKTHPDRCMDADYTRIDARRQEEAWVERQSVFQSKIAAYSQPQWHEEVRRIRNLVQQIRARGGNVIFLRFPSSGRMLAVEQRDLPRSRFWDDLAQGMMAIHFEDVPALRSFSCPDGSHLDQRDKSAFTTALAREIKGRNWLSPSAASGQ